MELTNEILIKNGFADNHPERVLNKFYLHGKNPEYRVNVETQYHTLSNKLGYSISCYKCDERGAIIKRASVSVTNSLEDLIDVMKLCEIDKEIIA